MPSRRQVLVALAVVGVTIGLTPFPERLERYLDANGYGELYYGLSRYGGVQPDDGYGEPERR